MYTSFQEHVLKDLHEVYSSEIIDLHKPSVNAYVCLESKGSLRDSCVEEKEIEQMKTRLVDRFGQLPDELSRLFDIVRIRQLGQKLGFEKIIIKNGVIIAFFISNPLSQYYKSDRFAKILENVTLNPNLFELKQNDNRLRVFVRNINSLSKAYDVLMKLIFDKSQK